jgi:hypothetical protein
VDNSPLNRIDPTGRTSNSAVGGEEAGSSVAVGAEVPDDAGIEGPVVAGFEWVSDGGIGSWFGRGTGSYSPIYADPVTGLEVFGPASINRLIPCRLLAGTDLICEPYEHEPWSIVDFVDAGIRTLEGGTGAIFKYLIRAGVNGQVDVLAGGHRKSSLVAKKSPRGQVCLRVVRWVSR